MFRCAVERFGRLGCARHGIAGCGAVMQARHGSLRAGCVPSGEAGGARLVPVERGAVWQDRQARRRTARYGRAG